MFSLILFLLGIQLNIVTGEAAYLDNLDNASLTEFIGSKMPSVVVFEDRNYVIDFMNFGIKKFRNQIKFAKANLTYASEYKCVNNPCFVAFQDGKRILNYNGKTTDVDFTLWLNKVLTPHNYKIDFSSEQLIEIFLNGEDFLVGVDVDKRPSNVPDDLDFYQLSSDMMKKLRLNVTKGNYLFRSADRKLIPLNNNYEEVKDSKLTNLVKGNLSSKKYLVGFITDESNTTKVDEEITILNELANKFDNSCNFVFLNDIQGGPITQRALLQKANPPYFFVIDQEGDNKHRWVVQDIEEQSNYNYLESFLQRVINGEENFTLISAILPNQDNVTFKQICSKNFDEITQKNDTDVLVVITTPWCSHCKKFKVVLEKAAEVLQSYESIKFYWIDGTLNDLPDTFPNYEGYPTMFLWPAGKKSKEQIITFNNERSVEGIIKFLNNSATTDLTMFKYEQE